MKEFYERQKVIEKLQKDYEKKKNKLENQKQNYDALKNSWVEEVEQMIKDINEKFIVLFRQLKVFFCLFFRLNVNFFKF